MKAILLGLLLFGVVSPVLAVDRAELDDRVRMLTGRFEALQAQPDKRVPAEVLRKARGIVLLETTKAGFMFAFQGGDGVAMVKDKWGNWSPVAFLNRTEGSFGFQAGGEDNFYVILLMNTNATRVLLKPAIDFGAEAQGTAGDNSSRAEGKIVSPYQSVLVYDEHNGFYGGVAFKNGALAPNENDNRVYYGQYVSMSDILFGKTLEATPAAANLAEKIKGWSKK
ncbi:MAG TPA: lipid-binding SYLF domain-containing protein [Candidatus Sulfopaludibacter sp.]|nr:lipid-binding SYLF domain-containing protein [Candidatus Sulfopaludibacter sp.]